MALIALTYLFIEGGLFVGELRNNLSKMEQTAGTLSANLNQGIQDADATTKELRDAAQEQRDFYDPKKPGGATQQLYRLLVYLKDAAGRTDINLNGGAGVPGAIPQFTLALANASQLEVKTASDLDSTTAQIQPILGSLLTASKGAADTMSDPDIQATLKQVRLTSENVAGTTANLDATSHDIQTFVHRETAPVKGTWNVIRSFLVSFAGPAAEVATSIK